MLKRIRFVVFLATLPIISLAQLIPIRSVPVATGDQFLLFPSRNSSMGGVSIALDDPLLDPFINPAKGSLVEGMQFFTAPVYYGISFERSSAKASGRSLPLGLLLNTDAFFGGLLWARQELTNERRSFLFSPRLTVSDIISASDKVATPNNNYTFVMAGKKLPDSDISLGASVFWADLNAIEGVQHLYANSSDIRQSGYLAHYRVGLVAPLAEERTIELVLLRHQFKMTHDVTYQFSPWGGPTQTRTERNVDETEGWAARIGYREPIGKNWTLGLQLTGNWKWHPKIPNYELMNIPRDPGNSSAYNLGIGFAKRGEQSIVSFEYVYEPIWSNTWADADRDITTVSGKTIKPGWKTVENFFQFWNSIIRAGFHAGKDRGGFDLGLQVHSIHYLLNQEDFVQERKRSQVESWREWTLTGGITLTFSGYEVRYAGSLITGTGQPGVQAFSASPAGLRDALSSDFLIAPSGRLTLQEALVFTHQLSLIVKLN